MRHLWCQRCACGTAVRHESALCPKCRGRDLLSVSADAKTRKGEALGVLTGILYLAPNTIGDGRTNLCPHASAGCIAACLYTAGRGVFNSVASARIAKTREYIADPDRFMRRAFDNVDRLERKARAMGYAAAVRFNGTSDLPFEMTHGEAMEARPRVTFYDYTKSPKRAHGYADGAVPPNFSLTFSRSEKNGATCRALLNRAVNVAAVFSAEAHARLVGTERLDGIGVFDGFPVVNGDETDTRFLDTRGVIVALKAKGAARSRVQDSGFVISDPWGSL